MYSISVHQVAPRPFHSRTCAPGGLVAATTHWGDYGKLGATHAAVVTWCRAEGHTIAGVSWEVFEHWSDDPATRRTDVCHLLQRAADPGDGRRASGEHPR